MAGSRKYDKRSLTSLISRLQKFDGTEVSVGFFEEDRYDEDNDYMHVAEVAWLNERGVGNEIPSRPFMWETFNNKELVGDYSSMMVGVMLDQLDQGRLTQRKLKELGVYVQESMQRIIEEWKIPMNSLRWARVKGINDPLVYTGLMLDSVKFKVEKC